MLRLHVSSKLDEVGHELVVRFDVNTLAAALAVAAVVERVHRECGCGQSVCHVAVPPGVLTETVDEHHRTPHVAIGHPGLLIDRLTVVCGHGVFAVLRHDRSFAPQPVSNPFRTLIHFNLNKLSIVCYQVKTFLRAAFS